jgi:hypothetical protein
VAIPIVTHKKTPLQKSEAKDPDQKEMNILGRNGERM